VANWTEQAVSKSAGQKTRSLPGDPTRFPQLQPWERFRIIVNIDLVTDVLTGFSASDVNQLPIFSTFSVGFASQSNL